MPHATSSSRVSFEPQPVYSRLPRDDEAYVMRAFTKHAAHCDACEDAYYSHRQGRTLCSRGHRRALDVAQYVFNQRGQAYSMVDREGSQLVQIEIPPKAEAVRSLLKALERGLQLQRQPARESKPRYEEKPVVHNSERRRERKEKPAPIYTGDVYARSGKTAYVTRGSLAEKDMRERERYYSRRPAYFAPVEYSPRPIPIQGYYY